MANLHTEKRGLPITVLEIVITDEKEGRVVLIKWGVFQVSGLETDSPVFEPSVPDINSENKDK
jgi:hypothetical protein